MADGEWRIWLPDPDGRAKCDVIPIHATPGEYGTTIHEPLVGIKTYAIEFHYNDGSLTFYPWHSIIRAEYDPPTNP